MSIVVKNYVERFREHLESSRAYLKLVQRCQRSGRTELAELASNIGDADEPTAGDAFISFLASEGDASAMARRTHSRALAAFDTIGSEAAMQLKCAGQRMLESEYAVWHAHKKLLEEAILNPDVLNELSADKDMSRLIMEDQGFALHEQLSFSKVWKEIFPERNVN